MSTTFPISIDEYRTLPFDLYELILPSYFWLNSDFTTCYRFMSAHGENKEHGTGRLLTMQSSNPGGSSFNDMYSLEYDYNKKKLLISFLNEEFVVNDIKIFYGSITAIILHLIASDGKAHFFYSATSHPFSNVYKKIYDI